MAYRFQVRERYLGAARRGRQRRPDLAKSRTFATSLHIITVSNTRTAVSLLGVCLTIRSWRRNPPRNNLLTAIWTLSWSY